MEFLKRAITVAMIAAATAGCATMPFDHEHQDEHHVPAAARDGKPYGKNQSAIHYHPEHGHSPFHHHDFCDEGEGLFHQHHKHDGC